MRIYLSGPITGKPDNNRETFKHAATQLARRGHFVLNPVDLPDSASMTWIEFMKRDLCAMFSHACDTVVVLDGWRKSRGAVLEVAVAQALQMPVLDFLNMKPVAEGSILEEARDLVHGPRGADYGHPADDFAKTAAMLTGLFYHKLADPRLKPITAADVPLLMICVKLSREAHAHKRDNLVDVVGYAETCHMVRERERETQ